MNHAMSGAAVALLLVVLGTGVLHAQDADKLKEESAKQQSIYQSQGDAVPRGYVVGRALGAYTSALPPDFERKLFALTASERWLDIGAGEGRAILEYYLPPGESAQQQNSAKAQAVAISIEDRRTFDWHKTAAQLDINKVRYLYGKSLSEYTQEELGKFQVITDLLGGFSYTRNLSRFMEKTLDFLQVNGSFYSVLQDVHAEDGSNPPHYPGAPYLTEIVGNDGAKTRVCAWLKSISCVRVTCELRPRWTPPIEIYHVQKVCDKVAVPTLTPVHFAAGTPPERRYLLAPTERTAAPPGKTAP